MPQVMPNIAGRRGATKMDLNMRANNPIRKIIFFRIKNILILNLFCSEKGKHNVS